MCRFAFAGASEKTRSPPLLPWSVFMEQGRLRSEQCKTLLPHEPTWRDGGGGIGVS